MYGSLIHLLRKGREDFRNLIILVVNLVFLSPEEHLKQSIQRNKFVFALSA